MKMNEMDQKEASKWMKMDQNHSKWMELSKIEITQLSKMKQMDKINHEMNENGSKSLKIIQS